MSKTIFVIGARAALARPAIRVLSADNTIITAGRRDCDVYCDVSEPFDIPDGVDTVLNFAASFGGSNDRKVIEAEQVNSLGMLNVCVAAKRARISHIVNVSSLSVAHDRNSPYYSIYAITKRNGDELAEFYCKFNRIPLTILRPSQVYGADNNFALHQPFFYQIMDRAEHGEDVTIFGEHDALRNYLHVDDFSQIICRVIHRGIEGTFACLYPENVTYSTIAKTAQHIFGKGGSVVFDKGEPDIPDNVFSMDLSIYNRIDYRPQFSIEKGIQGIKSYRAGGMR